MSYEFVPKQLTYVCSCGAVYDRGPGHPLTPEQKAGQLSPRLTAWKAEHKDCP